MGFNSKLNLNNSKFEQISGSTLNLSGATNYHNTVTFQSGSTFNILENRGEGKILTSDVNGNITLQIGGISGIPNNVLYFNSEGYASDSGIPLGALMD